MKNKSNLMLAGLGFILSAGMAYGQTPKCGQAHPGKEHRLESVTKRGDTRMALSVAGHTTHYAIEKYELDKLITQQDIDRVFHMKDGKGGGQMYKFLEWKLSSPTAVAVQFVSAGYQHFDRGYSDEAAAMLLGVLNFTNNAPDLKFSPELQEQFEQMVKEGVAQSVEGVLLWVGLDPGTATILGQKLGERAGKQTRKTTGINMPKSFDIDNRLIEAAIQAKRAALETSKKNGQLTPTSAVNLHLPGGDSN